MVYTWRSENLGAGPVRLVASGVHLGQPLGPIAQVQGTALHLSHLLVGHLMANMVDPGNIRRIPAYLRSRVASGPKFAVCFGRSGIAQTGFGH
jgi:hypothetical protein